MCVLYVYQPPAAAPAATEVVAVAAAVAGVVAVTGAAVGEGDAAELPVTCARSPADSC